MTTATDKQPRGRRLYGRETFRRVATTAPASTQRAASSRQAGASLIEFALVLPLLLLLLAGTIFYGYIFSLQIAVTSAAKQGAQAAVAEDPVGLDAAAFTTAVTGAVNNSVNQSLPDSIDGAAAVDLECHNGGAFGPGVCPADETTKVIVTVPQNAFNDLAFGPIPLPNNLTGVAEIDL